MRQVRLEMAALHEEALALRGCLEDAGVLRSERFLAKLHRQRFDRELCKHPLGVVKSWLSEANLTIR